MSSLQLGDSTEMCSIPLPLSLGSSYTDADSPGRSLDNELPCIRETPTGSQQSVNNEANTQVVVSSWPSENSRYPRGALKPVKKPTARKKKLGRSANLNQYLNRTLQWMLDYNIPFKAISSDQFPLRLDGKSKESSPSAQEGIVQLVLKKYGGLKNKVIELLANTDYKIHLSINLCTRGDHVSLDGVTAHFLDGSTGKL